MLSTGGTGADARCATTPAATSASPAALASFATAATASPNPSHAAAVVGPITTTRAVAEGRFRADLYYRLAALPLTVAPLRERPEDALNIAEAFLAERGGRRGASLTAEARAVISTAPWPGNTRQLVNALERALLLAPGRPITPADLGLGPILSPVAAATSPDAAAPFVTLEEAERQHVAAALRRTQGKVYGEDGAAALLGMKPSTLQSLMQRLGLRREAFV